MSSSFVKFDSDASEIFGVSTKSLELLKISSKCFLHSCTNSSLFAGGSPFLFFTFVALFVVTFSVMSLMIENSLNDWIHVAACSNLTHFCCR